MTISKIAGVAEKVSPKIAEMFGLKTSFVTLLICCFGMIGYGFYGINKSFAEQNHLIRKQIELTQTQLDSLNARVVGHEGRLITLETKYNSLESKVDNLSVRFSQQEAKMDLVSNSIRDITIQLMRRK